MRGNFFGGHYNKGSSICGSSLGFLCFGETIIYEKKKNRLSFHATLAS